VGRQRRLHLAGALGSARLEAADAGGPGARFLEGERAKHPAAQQGQEVLRLEQLAAGP
jgi:hypothetical protein